MMKLQKTVSKPMKRNVAPRPPWSRLKSAFGMLTICVASTGILGSCGAPQTTESPSEETSVTTVARLEREPRPNIICMSMGPVLSRDSVSDIDLSQPISRRILLDALEQAALDDARDLVADLPDFMSSDFELGAGGASIRNMAARRCLEAIATSEHSPQEASAEVIMRMENGVGDSFMRRCSVPAHLLSRVLFDADTQESDRQRIAMRMAVGLNTCVFLIEPVTNLIADPYNISERMRRTTIETSEEVYQSVLDIALNSSTARGRINALVVLSNVAQLNQERMVQIVDAIEQILNEQNLERDVGLRAITSINRIRCNTRNLNLRTRIENILHDCTFRVHGSNSQNPLSTCTD